MLSSRDRALPIHLSILYYSIRRYLSSISSIAKRNPLTSAPKSPTILLRGKEQHPTHRASLGTATALREVEDIAGAPSPPTVQVRWALSLSTHTKRTST